MFFLSLSKQPRADPLPRCGHRVSSSRSAAVSSTPPHGPPALALAARGNGHSSSLVLLSP